MPQSIASVKNLSYFDNDEVLPLYNCTPDILEISYEWNGLAYQLKKADSFNEHKRFV